MKLSDLSIRNPVFAWMLMAALIVFGLISFSRLGVSQMPDADFPVLNVSVGLEGAAPEIMETTVVDPIEDSLMTIEGVQGITSTSKTGNANITIEFELGRNIDVALQEVQTKVALAQRRLPKDIDPPIITKTNPDDNPILWLAMTYEKGDLEYMMKYARDTLKDQLTTVPGVGDVILGGYTDPVLRVWVKPETLQANNISVNDIVDAIQKEHAEYPGGQIDEDKKTFNVRTMGEAKTVAEFENLVISSRAGQTIADPSRMVRIKQVAQVSEGLDEIKRISRFNGVPSLGLGIRKQRGSNAVEVAKAVKAKVELLKKTLPPGLDIKLNFDSTRFIEASIHELNMHLILAVILTSLVCWLFLGSWSATFNVLLSIPTSIIGTFIGLYFFKFTLNTFTLLGLTLSIGIVVDDAIMVLENIFRYREHGKGRIESAIIGAREISFAAIAATVAVIAIFLPVAFMKGVIGVFFMQFGVTISLAVLLSLLESLTITPMRCAEFVSAPERTTKFGKAFETFMKLTEVKYERGLRWCLQHRLKVALTAIVFLALSFYSVKFLTKEFTPVQDQGIFIVRIQLPVGSSLAYTNAQTKKAEDWFMSRPEVRSVYASVGGFSNSAADSNVAMLFITLKPKAERGIAPGEKAPLSQQQLMGIARKELSKIQDLKPVIQDLSSRGFSASRGFPVEFMVQGGNWDELYGATKKIMDDMENSGMMTDVDSNYLLGLPEIQITPDRMQAALHGVNVSSIGKTVNALIGGIIVGQFPKDGKRYDIRLKLLKNKDPKEEINSLYIGNARSNLIPLSRVVSKDNKTSLQQITRVNRQRAISVFANLKPGVSQPDAMKFIEDSAKKNLPIGYFFNQQGSSQVFQDSAKGLIFALILGLVVAYMVLASQFNSFIDPISVLIALPFSISGAFFALLITQQSLNIFSMIGILLLMGIVKKNSIMLVEFANTLIDRHQLSTNEAMIQAGPIRLRPIIMTSLSTVAGAIPSAVAMGEGSETMRPMALTIIGGVLVSTVLTLFVVPVVYSLLDKIRRRTSAMQKTKEAFEAVGNLG